MRVHLFEIELTDNPKHRKIFMDGKSINATSIKIESAFNGIPMVTITVPASVKMIGNSNIEIREG